MKILHIAKNIPTKYKPENDIILRTIVNYSSHYETSVSIIYPLEYVPSFKVFERLGHKYVEKMNLGTEFSYESLLIDVYKYLRLPTKNISNLLVGVSDYLYCNKQLLKKYKGQSFDVIHCHYLLPDGIVDESLGVKSKIKIITIRQGDVNKLKNLTSKSLEYKLYVKSINSATILITPSYSVKKYIEGLLGVDVKIIPHGCDLVNPTRSRVFSERNVRIATSANFIARKNIDWVIKAVGEYKGSVNVELFITGDGPEYERLASLAPENVTFLGKVSQKENYNLFSSCDFFVLPSRNETFGRVYIEALSCGLPCIALKDTGLYGYPVEKAINFVSSYDELCEAMYNLIEDSAERAKMSSDAVKLANDLFSWTQVLSEYYELYNSYKTNIV
ncbi:glycosyltransferase family 4 protein [Vibrio alginolyticus]|nr:glycosyltransferase family 4 protein [Vibrio alginolyticus]